MTGEQPSAALDAFEERFRRLSNWGRWGPDDQRGALNLITADKVRRASTLVRRGRTFSLQLPLDEHGPQTGAFGRVNPVHQMVATGTDHAAGAQEYGMGWGYADDSLFLYLQGGTQWDALAHIFRDGRMYNGYPASLVTSKGAARNGVEHYATLATRGVLLDLPRLLGRPYLEPGEGVGPELLEAACQRQGVEVEPGDIVLLRTGDMARRRRLPQWDGYAAGDAPGLTIASTDWLAAHDVAGVASDTWGVEVRPNELPGSFQPVHLLLVVAMGLAVGEIWHLDDLAADCAEDGVYEFLLVAPALVIPGAVGSPVNPQALK
ncbi:cyclase family protein [Aciditerrimonas ferrireducens]|jgi:kynurenine formamidase|uniref:Cyclase family protein n=1 Tax=Aciditerrimonas ferrireducens TaxID=667306 RepID=A0ABV6BZE5_9ACTN